MSFTRTNHGESQGTPGSHLDDGKPMVTLGIASFFTLLVSAALSIGGKRTSCAVPDHDFLRLFRSRIRFRAVVCAPANQLAEPRRRPGSNTRVGAFGTARGAHQQRQQCHRWHGRPVRVSAGDLVVGVDSFGRRPCRLSNPSRHRGSRSSLTGADGMEEANAGGKHGT